MRNRIISSPCVSSKSGASAEYGYLHLGGEKAVRSDEVIGIFDIDNTTVSRHTRRFLNSQEKNGSVENLAPDIPVSFVFTAPCLSPGENAENNKQQRVYLSQYSPRSVGKRAKENPFGV